MIEKTLQARSRRDIFLRRAADAEMKALRFSDQESKMAWADIAMAWNAMARELQPEREATLGATLQRLAMREGEAVI